MTDLRRKNTDSKIINGFAELLLEKNFSDITVKDIVSKATIHRNTFYLHFADKFSLLQEFIAIELNKLDLDFREILTTPFALVASLHTENLASIIDKQSKDHLFIIEAGQAFIRQVIIKTQDRNILFSIGKILAIFLWSDFSENQNTEIDIFQDYQQLDQIFQLQQLP